MALSAAAFFLALPVWAQYPGQVAKSGKEAPELRAIAVLEWIGEAGSPKACRLVPVAVLDGTRLEGDQLQDGGIYLARPQPLALAGEVEYELQQNGKPIGLFDIKNSGQEQGTWVGYGAWKQPEAPKPKPSMEELARLTINDEESDRPVLHRKHHTDEGSAGPGDGSAGKSGDSGAGSASTAPAPSSDPDRPTLHKKESSSDTPNDSAPAASSGSAPDSDQPTLHRRDSSDSASTAGGSAPAGDSDRPVIKKSKKKAPEDLSYVNSLPEATDPDRPRLKRGKPNGSGLDVLPSLLGLPPDMQQAIAVSDTKSRPEHPWGYEWANPEDEAKMKSALEEIARDALGMKPPPPPPAPKRMASRKNAKPAPPPEPPPPAPLPPPLYDENFRVFELAYGSGATLVLTARTDGPLAQQKFVTLIAQPDLYGNVLVLLKKVAYGANLDETPRMRLIDAVDAMADNRGELLFELRGATQRQFALYRVLRGQAEQLFVTSGGEFGTESAQ
ncbi:MAG: hypothetical protein ABSC48_09345 [Terracidiphilus sp.]|jgi:hypothetical protein